MSFASDCEAIPQLSGSSRRGLQALMAPDRAHVSKRRMTALTTSISIDAALKASQPEAPRWDYGVAEKRGGTEIVHWIEIHPASGGNCIAQMQSKLRWLTVWLRDNPLATYQREVVWIATGKSAFTARHPNLRVLAQAGLRFAGGHYAI
jgi:hypothetical protein